MSGLDFLVIGAQKAGTTTLWQLLREHPQLELPAAKEAPFFADDRLYALGIEHYEASFFGPREPGVLRGSVSPQYMFDSVNLAVSDIATRIAAELPDVRLVAILRDPVERAISHHRMSVRRGYERRSLERALRDQLSPGALAAARGPVGEFAPAEAVRRVYSNSRYLASGEYGRILATYRRHFDRSQLLIVLTSELATRPHVVLAEIFRFLGVDEAWRPVDLDVHRLVGGDRARVSPEDLRALERLLVAAVPHAPFGVFDVALEEWNTVAGAPDRPLPDELDRRLRDHFGRDAQLLEEHWNVRVPWAAGASAPDAHARRPVRAPGAGMQGADEVAAAVNAAIEEGTGYALIHLEPRDTVLLDEAKWPVDPSALAALGVRQQPEMAAAALREAIRDADAVFALAGSGSAEAASRLERLLHDQELSTWLNCRPTVSHELLGVDPATGSSVADPPLQRILSGCRLAAVCPAALVDWVARDAQTRSRRPPQDQARREDFDVEIAVRLDDIAELDRAMASLAAQREAYDAVLVLGDLPARLACVRIARELEVVALDLGMPIARFLHPGYNGRSAQLARRRWELEEYLRRQGEPPPNPPHALEGRLIRAPAGTVFYVERGCARLLEHPALLALFDHEPLDAPPGALDDLSPGAPLAIVHERLSGPFVLLDGRKRAIELGATLVELDEFVSRDVPEAGDPLLWHPPR